MYLKRLSPKSCSLIDLLWIGCNDPTLTSWIFSKEVITCASSLSLQFMLPPLIQADPTHIMPQHPKRTSQNCTHWTKEFLIVMNDWLAVFYGKNTVRNSIANTLADDYEKITHFLQREIHKYLGNQDGDSAKAMQLLKLSHVCPRRHTQLINFSNFTVNKMSKCPKLSIVGHCFMFIW